MSHFPHRAILSYLLTFALLLGLAQASFSEPALANDCSWTSRPGLDDKTQTVTVKQIAFDLCYVAGQLFQPEARASGWAGQATPDQIMQQMEGIVAETNFLTICPHQTNDFSDQTDPDHAVPHHASFQGYGCGPYPSYWPVDLDNPTTFQAPKCPTKRPMPYDPFQYHTTATGHPPTKRETAAFDLCHASTKITTTRPAMDSGDLSAYMINLMVEVSLALTCADGRPSDTVDGDAFSVPSPTNVDYIATRRLGCPPALPKK